MNEEQFRQTMRNALAERAEWTDKAGCHGLWEVFDMDYDDTDINGKKSYAEWLPLMRTICDACPVKQQCLDDSVLFSDAYGFRAGLTAKERYRLRITAGGINSETWHQKQKLLAQAD